MAAADLYEQFTAGERVALALEALARGDEAEVRRLEAACPRRSYRTADAAYSDRLQWAVGVAGAAWQDLSRGWGKLEALEGVAAALGQLNGPHHVHAALAFMEGMRLGQGLPPLLGGGGGVAIDEAGDEGDDDEREDAHGEADAGAFGRRLGEVADRSERATGRAAAVVLKAAAEVALGMAEVREAVDRFARRRLGVGAEALLGAGRPGASAGLGRALGRYGPPVPREGPVAEYARLLEGAWDRRFGGHRP